MGSGAFDIRPAHFNDAREIFALIRSHPDELVPRPIADILSNIDRFLVAESDGKIIGIVSWGILPELGSAKHPSVEIKSLAVSASHRRAGVGRALVEECIARIQQLEPEQIIALTFAPEFFAKLGFDEISKERIMHKLYTGCMNCTRYDSPFTCPEIAMSLKVSGGRGVVAVTHVSCGPAITFTINASRLG